jgi:hypothetical protein
MREFLTSGKVGNIELNAQKRIREEIQKRWESLGFVDGLQGSIKENIATLYENEAKHLIYEATSADNSGSFETVVFPIIRRVFSKLLANDIVSVQAMNLPIGKLFFILPVTSERQWDMQVPGQITDGDTGSHVGLMGYTRHERNDNGKEVNRYYLPDEVINTDAAGNLPEVVKFMKKSLYDLFYNDFLYDNSKGKITIKVGEATPMYLGPDGFRQADSNLGQYRISGIDDSIRNIILKVNGFSSYNAGRLTGPDGNEMDTESFMASLKVMTCVPITDTTADGNFTTFEQFESIKFRLVTQQYGKGIVEYNDICDAEGNLYIELDLCKPVRKQGSTLDGYIGVDPAALNGKNTLDMFKIAWAQYSSLELETEIGEVSFKLDSVTVSVEERKLRATWSPELAQDVAAFHNIDAEAELTAILSEQIAAEIDREILRDLRKAAPWQARWDANGWRRMAGYSTNYTQKDWNQELMTKVNQISAQIHKATLRGGANFIVVSSEISALFDNLEYFHVTDASAESDQYNMGIERVGSLGGRYQVYRDPYAPYWSLIMGHKGKSLLDTGYIYAPYVPMQLTPTMYNPFNFAPIKGIATRYAKKLVNNRYYGGIVVDGLTTWNINELR